MLLIIMYSFFGNVILSIKLGTSVFMFSFHFVASLIFDTFHGKYSHEVQLNEQYTLLQDSLRWKTSCYIPTFYQDQLLYCHHAAKSGDKPGEARIK